MAEKYNQKYTIACYEADANQLLKPTAMLDWMQEVAGRDATRLGFGYNDLIQNQTAWVLSRTHVRFHQYPKWRDIVHLKTWHKGAFKAHLGSSSPSPRRAMKYQSSPWRQSQGSVSGWIIRQPR